MARRVNKKIDLDAKAEKDEALWNDYNSDSDLDYKPKQDEASESDDEPVDFTYQEMALKVHEFLGLESDLPELELLEKLAECLRDCYEPPAEPSDDEEDEEDVEGDEADAADTEQGPTEPASADTSVAEPAPVADVSDQGQSVTETAQ